MGTIACARCGEQVNAESAGCPSCGGDPRTGESRCASCGHPLPDGVRFCGGCGAALPVCPDCGREIPRGATFCGACGAQVAPEPAPVIVRFCPACGRPAGEEAFCLACGTPVVAETRAGTNPPPGVYAPAFAGLPADAGAPGIGIAGFVLSLCGVSLLGLILSWVGYSQAKREGRPTGLCVAGIVLGGVWIGISLIIFLSITSAASTYSY